MKMKHPSNMKVECYTGFESGKLHEEDVTNLTYAKCDTTIKLQDVQSTVDVHTLDDEIELCRYCFEFFNVIGEWNNE